MDFRLGKLRKPKPWLMTPKLNINVQDREAISRSNRPTASTPSTQSGAKGQLQWRKQSVP